MFNQCSRLAIRCALLAAGLMQGAVAMPPGPWAVQGLLKAEGLSEVSGLACSRRHPGLFWVHNDSGHRPELYAFDSRGRLRGRVRVEADLEDWEDLASFDWHGVPMLALADTGDNLAWRREVRVWLVEEPQVDQSSVRPRKVLRFTYPDGPRDVEALMVDVENGQLLLFEKRPPPARLYALALEGPEQQVARIVGELPAVPPSPAVPAETLSAWYYRDTVTAMDFDPIHRALYVLTYHRVLRFRTGPQRPWADVLQQAPDAVVPLPRDKRLYEALAVDAQGHLWATSEGADPPLMRLRE